MKIGDKVRFIYECGGGVVKGFRGKDIALVEDKDGFEIPMPVRECVVVDTNEYNFEKKSVTPKPEPPKPTAAKKQQTAEKEEMPVITYRHKERPEDASGEPHAITHAPEALRYALMSRCPPPVPRPHHDFIFSKPARPSILD